VATAASLPQEEPVLAAGLMPAAILSPAAVSGANSVI
jgi:hypothetical protein